MHPSKLASLLVLMAFLSGSLAVSAQSESFRDPPQPNDSALIAKLDKAAGDGAQIFRHAATGKVRFIGMPSDRPIQQPKSLVAATPEQASRAFLGTYGQLFGLRNPERELRVMQQATLHGRSFVRFQQVYQGVPIVAGELIVQTDQQRAVVSANGEALPDVQISVQPSVAADVAVQHALLAIAKAYHLSPADLHSTTPQSWIFNPVLLGGPGLPISRLVWRMEVTAAAQPIRELVLIDAHTGGIALHFNQIADAKDRRVCNDNNTVDADGDQDNNCTPDKYVRVEGQGPTNNTDVDLAYDYAGITYDYYFNNFGRDSLDGKGLPLTSLVKYCPYASDCPYKNAFWDGQQMTYGESFASADDVVGHELTHGFTEFTSHLFYYYQSGAINESLSDVFGELIDQTDGRGNDTSTVRWLMGEDLPASIGAIRDMRTPPAFGDPDRTGSAYYSGYASDSGGVHTNSGVNNKAAYLMTDGGSFNGQTVSGLGAAKVGAIYYTLEVAFLTSGSDYQDLYAYLPAACSALAASGAYSITATDCTQVQKAVKATQMDVTPPAAPVPEAPVCATGQTSQDIFFDDLENPASGNWSSSAAQGDNGWYYPATNNPYDFDATYATSEKHNLWGDDPWSPADYSIAMTHDFQLPTNAFLRFRHAFDFESDSFYDYDGGLVEYSSNGGNSWNDAGALFASPGGVNGYNVTLASGSANPLKGRGAFGNLSQGYYSSRADLSSLAGQSVRFRFRIGADEYGGSDGWFIDDIRIYTCGNTPPTASLQTTSVSVSESVGRLAIQLKLSGVTDKTVSVPFTVSGTANENMDYRLFGDAFVIPAGVASGTVVVQISNDQLAEPDESVILTLGTPVNATLDAGTTATIIIQDSTGLRELYLPLMIGSEP